MGKYKKIDTRIWHDDKFPGLSDDAKLLWFFILTSPRSNMIGLFVQGKSDMAEYLSWSPKRLGKPFAELFRKGFIKYQESTRLIFIIKFLEYNPIENKNQAIGAIKALKEIPKTEFFQELIERMKGFGKGYHKPFLEALAKGMPNQEQEQEQEQEHKDFFVEDSKEFRLAKFLLNLILKRNSKFKKPNLQSWAKDFDAILRIDARPLTKVKDLLAWCQSDSFWQNNILCPSKFREKYDQLDMKRYSNNINPIKPKGQAPWNRVIEHQS